MAVVVQGWEFGRNLRVPRHQHRRQHWEEKTGNSFKIKQVKHWKMRRNQFGVTALNTWNTKRLTKGQDLMFASGITAAGEDAVYSQQVSAGNGYSLSEHTWSLCPFPETALLEKQFKKSCTPWFPRNEFLIGWSRQVGLA